MFEPGFFWFGYQQHMAYAQRECVFGIEALYLCVWSRFCVSPCFKWRLTPCSENKQMSTRPLMSGLAALAQKGSTELSTASVRNSGAFGQQQQVARAQPVVAEGTQADVVALFMQIQGAVQ